MQTHTEDQDDALGAALISDQKILASYHGVLGSICTCRAWVRGVAKYLAVFDSSRDELRELVSLDCKVPCMDNVRLACTSWCFSMEDVHLVCIQNRGTPPGSRDTLFEIRGVYSSRKMMFSTQIH